jgi:methylenetetrahydrofolate dehydrogenase (NADP+)/methenyltetrahydrofolate cyclohydrolase
MTIKEYVAYRKALLTDQIKNLEVIPHLMIIQINDDPASQAYVKGKLKDCAEVGIRSTHLLLDKTISEEEVLSILDKYNNDPDVHGIIVQMPLPKQINEEKIKVSVAVEKDVDGFNPLSKLNPCTPYGIIKYLKHLNFDFVGKNAVVVGRPMNTLLINESCNVTVLHSKTKKEDMAMYLKNADLVVSAIGKKYVLDGYEFKKSAYLIDVGINRVDGKLYGDFPPELDVTLQTPVPGGVGLLTRLTLLENLLEAYNNEI